MTLESIYSKHYKKLILIPLILFIASVIILVLSQANTGSIVDRDVNLKGGIEAVITKELNFEELKVYLESSFEDISVIKLADATTSRTTGISIKVSGATEEELRNVLAEQTDINFDDPNEYSVSFTEGQFAADTYKSLMYVLIIGFILMGIAVSIAFRNVIASMAIISAALMDVIITLAVISVSGMKLTEGGIAALLLIIAYSIDTDVLLTTKMLKQKQENMYVSLKGAMKTGLTMTATTLVALSAAYFIVFNPILKQIFLIIIIAMFDDVITTYLSNGSMLIWYMKKKNLT